MKEDFLNCAGVFQVSDYPEAYGNQFEIIYCKQILCALLASLNVVNMLPVYAYAAEEEIQPVTEQNAQIGDVNCDGSVDQSDVTILSKYFAGWKDYDELILNWDAADFDQNGSFTRKDVMCLARYVDKWEGYTLPDTPEYPEMENNFRIASTTVDKNTAIVGSIFEWTAEAVGGEGQVNYAFELKKLDDTVTYSTESSETVVASQDYGPENYFCVNVSEAGNYAVTVSCKDASDTVCTLQNICPVVVTNTELEKITVTSDAGKSVCQGETLTWSVKTFGGNAPFTYQYSLLCDQNEIDFITSEESVYTYENCQPGEYQLMVRCTDADEVRKTVLSDAVRAYTTVEYSPAAPEVRVAGDVVVLSAIMEDTNSVEAQSLLLEWDAVNGAKQYYVELAYRTGNDWYVINSGESITANRYTLSANLFQTAVAERLYRIGVYSKGIVAGEMRYYYFRMTPVEVNETILVDGTTEVRWDSGSGYEMERIFDISSDFDWQITEQDDWIDAIIYDNKLKITLKHNSGTSRSGSITLSNGYETAVITVNQGSALTAPQLIYPILSNDMNNPTNYQIGGMYFEVDESGRYNHAKIFKLVNNEWLEVCNAPVQESYNDWFEIPAEYFDANEKYRVTLYTCYSEDFEEYEVEEQQLTASWYFVPVEAGHYITLNGRTTEEYSEDDTIVLFSSNLWSWETDCDWITIKPWETAHYNHCNGKIGVSISENTENIDRSGTVTFSNGYATATLIVTQESIDQQPKYIFPENMSQDFNNPTVLPYDDFQNVFWCTSSKYEYYENNQWVVDSEKGADYGELGLHAYCYPKSTITDVFKENVIYRETLTNGENVVQYYFKFSSAQKLKYVQITDATSFSSSTRRDYTEVYMPASGGGTQILLRANTNWTVTSDSSWLTISSGSGGSTSEQSLTISTTKNTTGKKRTGYLAFMISGQIYAKVCVTQAADDNLVTYFEYSDETNIKTYNIETDFMHLDGSSHSQYIYVACEDNYSIQCNNDWIKIKNKSTASNIKPFNSVKIGFAKYTSGNSPRTGSVTITYGGLSKNIYFTQEPQMDTLNLVSTELSMDRKNPTARTHGDVTITWESVENAVKYRVMVSPEDTSIEIKNFYSFDEYIYADGSDRYSITIPARAFSLEGKDDISIVSYNAYDHTIWNYYYIQNTASEGAYIGGTKEPVWDRITDLAASNSFLIQSTSDWTAQTMQTWITLNTVGGVSGDTLTVTVAENTGSARSGQVVITVGSTKTILTVNQCAYLPMFPSISSPDFSDDEGNPTVIPADTSSITVKWFSAPQAEEYQVKFLSYSTTSLGHIEQESKVFEDGENEYTFTDLDLVSGQMYMISIHRKSHWGRTRKTYYFIAEQSDAWVETEYNNLEHSSDEDYDIVDITSSGVWSASTDTDWIMLENEHITQAYLDQYDEISSYYHSYTGVSGEPLYISVLANPNNTYRYGTVTVRSGSAAVTIEISQAPYYELAEIYSPIMADRRQDSVGLPYGNVTVRWDECVGGAGTYQIILEEREEDSTYQYYDILEETNITKTSYTIPVSKLREGGYYCLTLCSDLIDVDTDDSPCKRYYFYVKYENELTVSADVEWDTNNKMVMISASATGGAGEYQFAYELLCDGEQVGITDIDEWDYYTFPITDKGEYQVRVYCRDAAGFSDELYSSPYDFENTVSDYVALSQNSWSIDTSGGSVSIIIQSNSVWAIESYPSWVSCSSDDGKNGDSVILSVGVNTSTERTGNITFVSGAARTSLSVVQESAVLKTVITYPLNSAVIDIGDIPVKWNQMKEADSYLISVRDLTTDVLLVNQHPTTDVMYTISSTSLVSGHNYRVAVGTVVVGTTWWTESTFSIKKPEDTTPVEHSYQRVTVGTQLINQDLSVHDVITTYYEKCSICGDTTVQKTDTVTVAHNFTYTGYESKHTIDSPHAMFHRCACGVAPYIDGAFKTANGQVQDKADCCICHGHKYDTENPDEEFGRWYVSCLKCGITKNVDAPAECPHPNGFVMGKTVYSGLKYLNHNDPYSHTCHNASYTVYCCSYCGEADWATGNYIEDQEKYEEAHTFNEDAVCIRCEYVSMNGIYDYTERYELSVGTRDYLEDNVSAEIGERLSLWVYDHVTGEYCIPFEIPNISLSLKDPKGIGKFVDTNTITVSNYGNCELVLSYFDKQVDNVWISINKKAIIVVPGVTGSELFINTANGTEKIWFDPNSSACMDFGLFGGLECDENGNSKYNIFTLDESASPYGTIMPGEGPIYENLVTDLERYYEPKYDVRFFSYDWRLTNTISADKLHRFIEDNNYDEVILVAHSMGGIVSSLYMYKYGAEKVDKLITLGTPYYGSPKVFGAFETGEFLDIPLPVDNWIIKDLLPDIPAAYELLPFREYFNNGNYYMEINRKGSSYGGMSGFFSAREWYNDKLFTQAEKLREKLNTVYESIISGEIDTYVIVGYNTDTVTCYAFEDNNKISNLDTNWRGDGTVPLISATFNYTKLARDAYYVNGVSHQELASDGKCLQLVKNIINGNGDNDFGENNPNSYNYNCEGAVCRSSDTDIIAEKVAEKAKKS